MSDSAQWKGRLLGAYRVGERLADIPEDEDQLHTAHHVETGEPALVVVPGSGDAWRGATPWSAATTYFTEPRALVFHPRQDAGTKRPRFHALTVAYVRLAGALAQLDERAEVRALFMGWPRPVRPWRRAVRWGLAGTGIVLAVWLALLLWPHSPLPPEMRGLPSDVPILSDGHELPTAIAYPMPEKPFEVQRKPPCMPKTEEEIRGGCWIRHRNDAPCPPGTAEYLGGCYVAVKKPDPKPTSIQPE